MTSRSSRTYANASRSCGSARSSRRLPIEALRPQSALATRLRRELDRRQPRLRCVTASPLASVREKRHRMSALAPAPCIARRRGRMSKIWKLVLVAPALIAAATAIGAPRLGRGRDARPTRWSSPRTIDDIISLDPAEAYELSGIEVDHQRLRPHHALRGGRRRPSWSAAPPRAGRSATTARPSPSSSASGMTFHSGAPVTAERRRLLAAARRSSSTRRRPSSSASSAGPRTMSTRW